MKKILLLLPIILLSSCGGGSNEKEISKEEVDLMLDTIKSNYTDSLIRRVHVEKYENGVITVINEYDLDTLESYKWETDYIFGNFTFINDNIGYYYFEQPELNNRMMYDKINKLSKKDYDIKATSGSHYKTEFSTNTSQARGVLYSLSNRVYEDPNNENVTNKFYSTGEGHLKVVSEQSFQDHLWVITKEYKNFRPIYYEMITDGVSSNKVIIEYDFENIKKPLDTSRYRLSKEYN